MKPTPEQSAIVEAFNAGGNLVVEAGAGTGKTSTLKMVANSAPARRGVYVAYNKAIATDAQVSFPRNVLCKTAHALAYGAVGRRYAHRLKAPRMPARDTARILGINEPVRISDDKDRAPLSPQQLARIATAAVDRFCYTDDAKVEAWHVPRINGIDTPAERDALAKVIVPLARKAWDTDITQVDGRLRFSHDCYLKIWGLSKPVLAADYVLLDEAQDSNPVVSAIVNGQAGAQQILVGDRSQAIYGWRGARDAMARFNADSRLTLSQSFRFGPAIAVEANKWLVVLRAPLRLSGHEPIASRLHPLVLPDAILCRSNGAAISQVMHATAEGRRAALVGGGRDIRRMAEAALSLKAGRGTDHPELFVFTTWNEVQDYVEQDSAGSDLKVFVSLVDRHGPEKVIGIVDRLVDERYADVVISTAHKAKGREWEKVRIADDFRAPKKDESGVRSPIPAEDAMLAYVAVTRAREVLDREGLAWVDEWVNDCDATFDNLADELESSGTEDVQPTASVRHCARCGSQKCICDPATARRWRELTGSALGGES